MKIEGISAYLPDVKVHSEQLDERFGWTPGTAYRRSGVRVRHFVKDHENAIDMAERAYAGLLRRLALRGEGVEPAVMIGTSGTPLQMIPFNASFFKQRLFPQGSAFPAFDVNSTCLSFLWGLQLAHSLPYESYLLVSSDVASCGLNWKHEEASLIFGDGAAVCWLDKREPRPFAFHFMTCAEGNPYCQIKSGGSLRHPTRTSLAPEDHLFEMDGKRVFKLVANEAGRLMDELLRKAGVRMRDIAAFIPHQASVPALRRMRKEFGIAEEQFVDIFETHGNQVGTSIPTALFRAVEDGRIKRGDKVMLFGTSAGVSIGGAVFEY